MNQFAYIITAYTDPGQLYRLVTSLKDEDFYIHIDKKVDINPFKELLNKDNVHFLEDRVEIRWGGYSQVESLRRLLNEVKNSGKDYKRVTCLSGTDYPVYSNEKLIDEFNNNSNKEYISAILATDDPAYNWKVNQYWHLDYKNNNKFLDRYIRGFINFVWFKSLFKVGYKKKDYLQINDEKWNVYFGSDYWSLTFDCAMNVLDNLNSNEVLTKYFKSSYAPSELVIPTMVFNSKYKDNATLVEYEKGKKIRYEKLCNLHYEVYEPLIKVMTIDDKEDILNSGKLFFRKAKTGESDSLIEYLKKL